MKNFDIGFTYWSKCFAI